MRTKLSKIAIVDDDDVHNFVSERLIKKLEITDKLIIIKNGSEALDYIQNECMLSEGICPELVFMDYTMPGINGVEVIAELKDAGIDMENPNLVFIMLSANSMKREEEGKMKEMGVKEWFVKPLTEEKLVKVLDKYFY